MYTSAIRQWLTSKTALGLALTVMIGTPDNASSEPFGIAPRQYDTLANRALMQVGSDFRFALHSCGKGDILECRFSSRHVTARVQGRMAPPSTDKIVLEADLLQDRADANPVTTITDIVLALGATVVIVDPRLPADKRVHLLSDLTNTALDSGRSEAMGIDAKYVATFDETANGLITITVVPAE